MEGIVGHNVFGVPIRESILYTEAKIRLDPKLNVSEEFRTKINNNLERLFGSRPCAYMMNTREGKIIVAHPAIVTAIKLQSM